MAKLYEQRPADDNSLEKKGGHPSPNRPVNVQNLPTVPSGPAQGASDTTGNDSSSSTSHDD
ncbi:hypothetical protein [Prauserella muralis]|uniref:Uncharacterized protein n=1 Tax=Prauserella muralis TaxID=588067 RepID=A0A2V4APJ9_9PSEU|nr:hypothetical protein [Prauserella muralis]PXY16591.1 hypothetical protein BAY60_35960 [Prauserella muralis]TWE11163.1 hypothetical protein FHX69_7382 [Prauserella muralis]